MVGQCCRSCSSFLFLADVSCVSFFFFSSRRRHTRWNCDWSSDVCSSDLDVLHPLGRAGDGRYQFKHALLRDAAYESLLLAERRRLHEQCGRKLEQNFPEVAESEPELLAFHFGQAGLAVDAADYLERAGDRASANAAYIEAIASYREALRKTASLAEDEARDRRELGLLLKLGPPLSI